MLSIVLPTSNEAALDFLPRIINSLASVEGVERIVVDNASDDGTRELLESAGWKVITLAGSNRAQRLNAGIAAASARRVLLHHPRSLIDAQALVNIAALPAEVVWGACTHAFDRDHALLRWTSWYSNHIRLDRLGVAYLDHCVFLDRAALPQPVVPEVDIFEDTALSRRLRARARPLRLTAQSVTSSVRYTHNGILRQMLINQLMKVGYTLRLPNGWMNRVYERGLHLNTRRQRLR